MMIDAHLHTVRRPGVPRNKSGDNYASPGTLIEIMDDTGVDKGILLPGVSPECRKQYSTTEDVLDICREYPDRFIPFCNIDPRSESNSPDSDHSRQLMYYKEKGCKGVGEMTANLPFTDPIVLNFFDHCQKCKMPVLFHVGLQTGRCYGLVDQLHLPGLERCLKLFPDLTFIGHSQPFWSEISGDVTDGTRGGYPDGPVSPDGAVPRLLREYPNLCADISANSGYNALTRDEDFGPQFAVEFQDQLLMGTDTCSPANDFQHARLLRGWREGDKISHEAFEKISWQNANCVLDLGL
ncbi:MAG: amidohydrolase family protein [Candidatus Brocadiia bacterium]